MTGFSHAPDIRIRIGEEPSPTFGTPVEERKDTLVSKLYVHECFSALANIGLERLNVKVWRRVRRRKKDLGGRSWSWGDTHEITVPNGPAGGATFSRKLRTAIRAISRYVRVREHQHTRSVRE